MTVCEVCTWETDERTFVRPREGGKRSEHFFCCDECKETGLRVLASQGFEETTAVLGWDVFRPMWDET